MQDKLVDTISSFIGIFRIAALGIRVNVDSLCGFRYYGQQTPLFKEVQLVPFVYVNWNLLIDLVPLDSYDPISGHVDDKVCL